MKKFLAIVLLLVVIAFAPGQLFAASAMTPSVVSLSNNGKILLVKVACVAHTDGTFTSEAISGADTGSVYDSSGAFNGNSNGLSADYWSLGFRISNAWAVNPASGYPTVAAVVTVTDATGQQLIGATVGDTLTLSTSASGVAYLVIDRSGSQRLVTSALTVAIGDTGTAANTVDIYLVLERF